MKNYHIFIIILLLFFSVGLNAQIPTENLQLWLKADNIEIVNGKVSQWYDFSSNSYQIVQETEARRPAQVLDVLNGNPVIEFTNNSFLYGNDILDLSTNSNTIFIVGRSNSATGTFISKSIAGNASSRYAVFFESGAFYFLYFDTGARNVSASGLVSQPIVATAINDRSINTNSLLVNGEFKNSTLIVNNHNMESDFQFMIGAYGNTPASPSLQLNGYIAEIIFYNTLLSENDRKSVEKYLMDKYSQKISLGDDIVIDYGFCDTVLRVDPTFTDILWSTGATTDNIIINDPGEYFVQARDIFGRMRYDTINVVYPSLNFTNTRICLRDSLNFASTLVGNYDYLWSTGETTSNIWLKEAGDYWIQVTDDEGCSYTYNFSTTIDDFADHVSLGNDRTLCSGSAIRLESGKEFVSEYLWLEDNSTLSFHTVTETGWQKLVVTNEYGCKARDSIYVTINGVVPDIYFSVQNLCFGETTEFTDLSQSGENDEITGWQWTINETNIISTQNAEYQFENTGTQNINFKITTSEGCETDSSFSIIIKDIPTVSFSNDLICTGIETNFISDISIPDGTAITSLTWKIDDNIVGNNENLNYLFTTEGIFNVSLEVIIDNGCSNIFDKNIEVLSEYPLPEYLSLISPLNNYVLSSTIVDFEWNIASNTTKYSLILAEDENFSNILFNIDNIKQTDYTLDLGQLYEKIYWKVLAYNPCGEYSESEIRVIMSFDPENVTGITLWLSADNVETNNGKVSKWNDLSVNNYNIVQDNDNLRPTIVSSELKSLPAVKFNGTTNYLTGGDILNLGTSSNTFFFIFKGSNGYFMAKSIYANSPRYAFGFESNSLIGLYNENTSRVFSYNGEALRINNYNFLQFSNDRQNSANYYILNNTLAGQISIDPNFDLTTTNDLLIGAHNNDFGTVPPRSGLYFNGEIAEIMAFNTLLDDSELENIKRYFQYKYSEPVNLGQDIHVNYGFCDTAIKTASNPIYLSYLWSTGETDPIINVNKPGTYSVTVTDIFGFESSDEIRVFFPHVEELTDTIVCYGKSIVWNTKTDGSDYSYEWYGSSETTPSITISQEGDYAVVITDNFGCKYYSDTISFSFDNYEITSSIGESDITLCAGEKLKLLTNAEETVSYQWSTGSHNPEIIVTESGTYSVTVTNARGCVASPSTNVTISGTIPDIDLEVRNLCFGETTEFIDLSQPGNNDEIISWQWTINGTDIIDTQNAEYLFENTGIQNINFKVTTSEGCESDSSFNITIKESPVVSFTNNPGCSGIEMDFTSDISIPDGASITSIIWKIDNNIVGNEENLSYIFTSEGVFTVSLQVIIDNGCSNIFEKEVEILEEYPLPEYLSLVYPLNNYILTSTSIDFGWNIASNTVYYRLILATDESFTNIIYDIDNLTQTNYTIELDQLYDRIYWKVQAYNHCGEYIESETNTIISFSPNDIPELSLWLNGDNVEIEDGKVSKWNDLSRNNFDIIQEDENIRPTLVTSGLNSLPAVKFNGTTNYLIGGDILDLGTSSNTFFFIFKGSKGYFLAKSIIAASSRYAFGIESNTLIGLYNENTTARTLSYTGDKLRLTDYNFMQFSNHRNFNTNYYYLNNSLIGEISINGSFDLSSDNDFVIGTHNNDAGSVPPIGANYFFNGEIAEIVMFNAILTDTQLENIKTYFQYKYSQPVNLGYDIHVNYGFCDTAIKTAYNPIYLSYQWSTGETDPIINVNKPGTYSVTVTDIFGFESNDEIRVFFPHVEELTDTLVCYGKEITWNTKTDDSDYSYEWYGSSETTPSITISQEGEYAVVITDNLGCKYYSDTISFAFDMYEFTASIGPQDTTLCNGNRLMLITNRDETVSYTWNTGSNDPEILLSQSGTYSVTVTNQRGCTAEDIINVSINGNVPFPNFSYIGQCEKNEIQFIDESSSNDSQINEWNWKVNNVTISDQQNLEYIFNNSGAYNVQLTINTNNGCSDFINKIVTVYSLPEISFSPNYFCQNTDINFISNSRVENGEVVYNKWIFNDSDEFINNNITYKFVNDGINKVKLISSSNRSCSDSIVKEIFVRSVEIPDYTAKNTCVNENTYFINNTENNPNIPVLEWTWDFGDGNISNYSDPIHVYNSAGIFNSKLTIKYSNGCVATTEVPVEIYYSPEVNILNLNACLGRDYDPNISEHSESGEIISYYWEIGNSFSSSQKDPDFIPSQLGELPVKLEVITDKGCKSIVLETIEVYSLPVSGFSTTDYSGAIPFWVEFTNESENAVSYQWNFGDGNQSNNVNPINIFLNEGEYTVDLIAFTEKGCTDTSRTIIKAVNPHVDIALFDLKVNESGGYLTVSVSVLNNSNIPIYDLELFLNVGNGKVYREILDRIDDGAIINYQFKAEILNNIDFICVEVSAPILGMYPDRNTDNNIICNPNSDNIKIYSPFPNPASETFNIEIFTLSQTDINISLSNFNGGEILREKYSGINGYANIEINVENFADGIYILKIIAGNLEKSFKIEVMKKL